MCTCCTFIFQRVGQCGGCIKICSDKTHTSGFIIAARVALFVCLFDLSGLRFCRREDADVGRFTLKYPGYLCKCFFAALFVVAFFSSHLCIWWLDTLTFLYLGYPGICLDGYPSICSGYLN